MVFLRIAIILFLIIISSPLYAASYYIDYNSGDDADNGTTTSTPFQHCPGDVNATNTAASTTLAAGDVVYFKKGVVYKGEIDVNGSGALRVSGTKGNIAANGTLTDADAPFTVASGIAADDLCMIYNNSTTGAWVRQVGIYKVASRTDNENIVITLLDGSTYNNTAYSGGDMTYKCWTPITFTTITGFGTGTATISGENIRFYAFNQGARNYIRYSGLTLSHGIWPEGSDPPGKSDCSDDPNWSTFASSVNIAAIYNSTDTTISGTVIDNNTITDWWRGVSYRGTSNYRVIFGNTFSAIGSIVNYVGSYSLTENNTYSDVGSTIRAAGDYSVIRGNTITNALHGSSQYCGIHSDGIGPLFGSSYVWIMNNYVQDTVEYYFLEYNSGGTNNYFLVNNIAVRTAASGDTLGEAFTIDDAHYPTIENNIIYAASGHFASTMKLYKHTTGCDNATIKNNIIIGLDSSGGCYGTADSESSTNLVADNNFCYIPNGQAKPYSLSGTTKTFAEWQAAGYDTSGTCCATDPLLANITAAPYDFSESATSPTLEAGATGIYAYDHDNIARPQNTKWDIGSYERPYGASSYTLTYSQIGQGASLAVGTSDIAGISCTNNSMSCSASYTSGTTVTVETDCPWGLKPAYSGTCGCTGETCSVKLDGIPYGDCTVIALCPGYSPWAQ